MTCVQYSERPEVGVGSPKIGVTGGCFTMWVLGIEYESSGREVSTLNC